MPTLDETGAWAGGWAWAELRLFEVVGGWVAAAPEPAAKALLAAQSRHHAERAEAWLGHRPVVAGRDPEDLVVPSSEGVAATLEDWVAAERLLQSLLRTGDDVAKASAHAARVESLLVT